MTMTETAEQLVERARSAIGREPSNVERILSRLEEAGPAGKRLAERLGPGIDRLEDATARGRAAVGDASTRGRAAVGDVAERAGARVEEVIEDLLEDEQTRTWGLHALFALGGLVVGFLLGWTVARRGSDTTENDRGIAQAPRAGRHEGAIPPTRSTAPRERAAAREGGDGERH
ncbi:MAG: hypothetical protein ACRDUY_03135 [Nitriliruptorales bacterium]